MAQCIQQINTSSPVLQPINKEIKGRGLEGKKIKSLSIIYIFTLSLSQNVPRLLFPSLPSTYLLFKSAPLQSSNMVKDTHSKLDCLSVNLVLPPIRYKPKKVNLEKFPYL